MFLFKKCPQNSCLKGGKQIKKKSSIGLLNGVSVGKINWQESYPSLILGAIIVVILGLLVVNYFNKRTVGEINTAESQEAAQTEEQIAAADQNYKIAANESLSKISEKLYGSQNYWPILAQVNNIANPDMVMADSEIKTPAKADLDKIQIDVTATSYKVQSGDTFFTIAEKVYGDGSQWTVLDKANGSRRLPNGNPLVLADSTIVVPR